MTDRFYPKGTLTSDEDSFKSSYTLQNEMRAFHRSAYPPGYAGHEPGVREKMGYASPGPHAWRLSGPEHALTEDVANEAPRMMHSRVKSKAHDESTFHDLDVHRYSSILKTQASTTLPPELRNRPMGRSMSSIRDLKPLSMKRDPISQIEDDRFTYFVPNIYSRKGKDKLKSYDLLKLEKSAKVVGANPGEGTGFRTQGGMCNWWPVLNDDPEISQIQRTYRRPPFHRSASATALHTF